MSNFTDFFPAAGGGGGAIPKYQEFTSSGTFTPTQALIDAGGRVSLFVVGGGAGGGSGTGNDTGGSGGEVIIKYNTLTTTSSIIVTIGSGGGIASAGASSTFEGSSAGGIDIVALGGQSGVNTYIQTNAPQNRLTSGFGGSYYTSTYGGLASAGSGVFGYGVGGSVYRGGTGIYIAKANSGSGSGFNQSGGSGFVRVTWFE
tara:strand:- start:93 stop:695 length:603 start_codon:yes stop_codon:yes gene_type:complete